MLCGPSPPSFAYYFSAFGHKVPLFGHLLLATALTEFKIMQYVCFNQAAECCVADLFMPARLWA